MDDLSALTVYDFRSCMDQCAIYNEQQTSNAANGGVDPCQAVTYNANLTANVVKNSGNCWLKTGRGARYNVNPTTNYALVASAYITADI